MDLKFRYKIIIVFLFLLLFPLTKFGSFINFGHSYREEWYFCIEPIEEGKLYQYEKDDPFTPMYENIGISGCSQGPILFYFIYPLYKFFWYSVYFIPVMYIVSFLLSFFIFLFLIMIIKKETGKYYILLTLILYILLILINLPNNLEMFLSIIFFLSAVYVLFYANYKYKEYLAGLFFVLSMYSKVTTIIFFIIFLVFYYLHKSKWRLKQILSYKKEIIKLFVPILFIALIFWFLYPTYFSLISMGGKSYVEHTLLNTLISLFNLFYQHYIYGFIIFFTIIISFFVFIRTREFYSLSSSMGSLTFLVFIINIVPHTLGSLTLINFVYENKFMIAFIFFIITFVIWYSKVSKNKKSYDYLLFLICLIIILVPALKGAYLIGATNNFMKEISYLPEIPKQEGDILMDSHGVYPELDEKADPYYSSDLFTTPERVEDYKRLGYNLSIVYEKVLKKTEHYTNKLRNKDYSLVITTRSIYGDIYQLISFYNLNYIYFKEYCTVYSGYVTDTRDTVRTLSYDSLYHIRYVFKDRNQCNLIKQRVLDYYNSRFDSICKKDEFIANYVIKSIFIYNGNFDDRVCDSKKDLIPRYYELKLKNENLILILILIGMIFIYWRYRYIENKIDLIVKILIILILIFIVIFSIASYKSKEGNFPFLRYKLASYNVVSGGKLYSNASYCFLFYEDKITLLTFKNEAGYLCFNDAECNLILNLKRLGLDKDYTVRCLKSPD